MDTLLVMLVVAAILFLGYVFVWPAITLYHVRHSQETTKVQSGPSDPKIAAMLDAERAQRTQEAVTRLRNLRQN